MMKFFWTFSAPPLLLLLLSFHLNGQVLAANDDISCPGEEDIRNCDGLWSLTRGFADFSAPSYPPKQNWTTPPPALTSCQCREACLRNLKCVAYDWITATHSPNCWLGTNASRSALTPDENNTHYALIDCISLNSGERIASQDLLTLQWLFCIFSAIRYVTLSFQ